MQAMKEFERKWKGFDDNKKMMYGGEPDENRSFLTKCSLEFVWSVAYNFSKNEKRRQWKK